MNLSNDKKEQSISKNMNSALKKASAELAVLAVIVDKQETYGFEIKKTLMDYSDGFFSLGTGSIYTILNRLIEQGFISPHYHSGDKKKNRVYYRATTKGRNFLSIYRLCFSQNLKHIFDMLEKLSIPINS